MWYNKRLIKANYINIETGLPQEVILEVCRKINRKTMCPFLDSIYGLERMCMYRRSTGHRQEITDFGLNLIVLMDKTL